MKVLSYDISLEPKEIIPYFDEIVWRWAKINFGSSDRKKIYNKLSELLEHDVQLMDALQSLHERAQRKGSSDPTYVVLDHLIRKIRSGQQLSEAFREFAPPRERLLLEAGEAQGDLGFALKNVARTVDATSEMKSKVISGLAYPVVLLMAVIGMLYFVGTTVIPQMAKASDPSKWTGVARSLYELSKFVQTPWFWTIPASLIGVSLLIAWSLPKTLGSGTLRSYLDKVPPWSLYRLIVGSGFLLSLSSMLRAGIPVQEALFQMRSHASPWLKQRLDGALAALRSGSQNIGYALAESNYDFPDREIVDDLTVYGELPNFDEIVDDIGQEWIEKGLERVETQSTILNSAGMAIMAGVIGYIAWGLFSIQQQLASAAMGGGV
jgi:type II secretory pathway component PulF